MWVLHSFLLPYGPLGPISRLGRIYSGTPAASSGATRVCENSWPILTRRRRAVIVGKDGSSIPANGGPGLASPNPAYRGCGIDLCSLDI